MKTTIIIGSGNKKKGLFWDAVIFANHVSGKVRLLPYVFAEKHKRFKKLYLWYKYNYFFLISFPHIRTISLHSLQKLRQINSILILEKIPVYLVKPLLEIKRRYNTKIVFMVNHEMLDKSNLSTIKDQVDIVIVKSEVAKKMVHETYEGMGIAYLQLPSAIIPNSNRKSEILQQGEIILFHAAGGGGVLYNGVGRKGTEYLISALDKVDTSYKLILLIQKNNYTKHLIELAKHNNNILVVEKHVNDRLYQKYLESSHLAIYPSKVEGYGLSLIEALSVGVPVVTTDASPMNEIVIDGQNGMCVSATLDDEESEYPIYSINVEALRETLINLMNSPTRLKEMGTNAKNHYAMVVKNFQREVNRVL
ncbi:MAG: glycosyltransferase family 4 protein [Candidatus Marinimicrobia bacterium]|nr:glycosyltransferase family 4 protein [Candidatus Neomarinimicrobiota bacterium]MCF7850190.1 glycosyltransferase family 4 protein [Candidatus Neomarinimicrobiota bacterium]